MRQTGIRSGMQPWQQLMLPPCTPANSGLLQVCTCDSRCTVAQVYNFLAIWINVTGQALYKSQH